jgi:hypothetical protein
MILSWCRFVMLNVLSETRSDDSLRKRPIKPPFLPCLSLPPTPYNTTETGPILFTKETHTTKMPPNTIEAKEHSPTLSRLLKARPAPSRETNLLNAAFSTTKPIKPPPGECCGSSCDPCVMDLYAQELKFWVKWRRSPRSLNRRILSLRVKYRVLLSGRFVVITPGPKAKQSAWLCCFFRLH